MSILASAFQLPSGARAARADCTGNVTKEDADAWLRQVDPGGPLHGLPILAVTLQLDRVASDARSLFARRGDLTNFKAWTAVVVTNPVIRVTTNFVMRMARNTKQRIFATEQEAILWLDERLREDAVAKEAR